MKKTYDWTSDKQDRIHTLRIYHGSKMVAKAVKIDGELLRQMITELKENGYTYKWEA